MTGIGLSVIVPTHESWPMTHRTLAAITHDARANLPRWELLVVDNGSGPDFRAALAEFAGAAPEVRVAHRDGLAGRPFQPGAARNLGIELARHEGLVFLDADCVPSPGLLPAYQRALAAEPGTVFVGHRVFVAADELAPEAVAADRALLDRLPPARSAANYGEPLDRRLPELRALATHPAPFDCMYSCDMAMHRDCLAGHRFDPVFDGYWGYEDIELGYRLHRAGRAFRYLPEAFVYHQEGTTLSTVDKEAGRWRNFEIAARLIPGFAEHRRASRRAGALPHPPAELLSRPVGG